MTVSLLCMFEEDCSCTCVRYFIETGELMAEMF